MESQSNATKIIDLEFATCDCCGLSEECTPAYISRVRERFQGRWICGLCSEAVKDEIHRSERLIETDEALDRHTSFCRKFRSSTPKDSTEHLISAMRQIMRRSLDSPRVLRSTSSTPSTPRGEKSGVSMPVLSRSESCFPTLAG